MIPHSQRLLTAEEYGRLPDEGLRTELVRGKVIPLDIPYPRYGQICSEVASLVRRHAEETRRGHLLLRSGIITERDPDTVRGGDVVFFSYARVPPGPLPWGYLDVVPELVFEVRSPSDRMARLLAKVGEYLNAGVTAVCVLDQKSETVQVYRAEELPLTLRGDEELHLPDILGDFRVPVRRFFE